MVFVCDFLTGMYFQIRDFVLGCPECQSRHTRTKVRSETNRGQDKPSLGGISQLAKFDLG